MRPSPLRHPVAVLRTIIGLGQKHLADLCSCSTRTIQAVELGNLKLSETLATKIAEATGASTAWLLKGDPAAPPESGNSITPYSTYRTQYTKDIYQFHRALLEAPAGLVEAAAGAQKQPAMSQEQERDGLTRPGTMSAFPLETSLEWMLESSSNLSCDERVEFEMLLKKAQAKPPQFIPITEAKKVMLKFEEESLEATDIGLGEALQELLESTRCDERKHVIRWRIKEFLSDLWLDEIEKEKKLQRPV